MDEHSRDVFNQQMAAQIAIYACEIPYTAIEKGFAIIINYNSIWNYS
jgi:hypothetical protein